MSAHGKKYWIKLYVELLNDDKVAPLNDSAYRRFIECLLMAGELNEDGFLPPLNRMAWKLRLGESALQTDLTHLAQNGLLELRQHPEGDERWYVTKFADRQAPSPGSERTREYRKRKKEDVTDTETYCDVTSVTKRHSNVTPSLSPSPSKRQPTPEQVAIGNVANAITDVTGISAKLNWGDVGGLAAELVKAGYTPEQIITHYGQDKQGGGWNWYEHDWRGKKGERPRLNAIRETIVGAMQPLPVAAANGSTAPAADSLWQRIVGILNNGGRIDDPRLAQAVKAIGGASVVRQANEYNTRQLKEKLSYEYQRATAAA